MEPEKIVRGRHSLPPITFMADSTDIAVFDDIALANQAKQGDRSAFTELVNRYAPKIYRTARHITKNDHDAEDVLQETFLKAYSRLDQFRGDAKFHTWLTRIGVNQALMKLRRRKDGKFLSLDQQVDTAEGSIPREIASGDADPEQLYGQAELRRQLSTGIDSLPESYRTVLVLRDIDGLSTEETAESLGLSVSAVKSRLLRARLQLRDRLRKVLGHHGNDAQG